MIPSARASSIKKLAIILESNLSMRNHVDALICSGSVVVTAYDSESGRPGSNPEWGLIYYEAPITAQG